MLTVTAEADRWILGLRGRVLDGAAADGPVVLLRSAPYTLRARGALLTAPGGVRAPGAVIRPLGGAEGADPAVLLGARVLSAVAFRTGGLRIVLDDGRHIVVRGGGTAEWALGTAERTVIAAVGSVVHRPAASG